MLKIVTLLGLMTALLAQCPDKDKYCAQCITSVNTTSVVGANGNSTINTTYSACRLCHGAFLGASGICSAPATRYSNCVRYDSSSNCLECDYNYYLSGTNQCSSNPGKNCATYTPVLGCVACNGNRLIKNGTCDTDNAKCAADNCDICSASNQCQRCSYGFVLLSDKNFTCISDGNNNVQNANNANITNYISYNSCLTSVGGICTECRYGYYSLNGTCAEATGVIQGGASSASVLATGLLALLAAFLA